jgi:hypothetical protein
MARSPNYPQIGLRKAIELAGVVYKAAHTAKAPASTIAAALGYNSLNGSSLGILSALKKYGLLESVGEDLRVSREGLTILVDPPSSADRAKAILHAAFRPALFADLRKEYGDNPPKSDDFLRAFLLKRGFLMSVVDVPIKTYRDTMSMVEEAHAVLGQQTDASEIDEVLAEDVAVEAVVGTAINVSAPVQPTPTVSQAAPATLQGPASTDYLDDVYKLGDGRAFVLRWPASMTREEFEEFTDWISLLQRKLKRSIS